MPFGLADLFYGFLVPAVVAAALLWWLRRWLPSEFTRPLVTALTFVAAFQVGYWQLAWQRSLAPLRPTSHWHWLPEMLLLTVLPAAPLLVRARSNAARFGAIGLITLTAAWFLVPDWEALEPSRSVHIAVFAAIVVPATVLLEPLGRRYTHPAFLVMLTAVMGSGAIVLALSGSLRFFQMAGCGVAALFGMSAAFWIDKERRPLEGIAFPFALLISALMLIGRVNSFSEVPLLSYVLPPVAPLGLWIAEKGPLAGTKGWKRAGLLSLPLLICAVSILFAVLPEFDDSSDW